MVSVTAKGHHFHIKPITNSYERRAVQLSNNIVVALRSIGVLEDDVDVEKQVGIKSLPARAEWFFDGSRCEFSHSSQSRFIDNLQVVCQVIEREVAEMKEGTLSPESFRIRFEERKEVGEERQNARAILGVDPECNDMEVINQSYKQLSKKLHPDMPEGDLDEFKRVTAAHRTLKRELA